MEVVLGNEYLFSIFQMNSIMDTIKFGLVIGLPDSQTFGYLIIASYVCIILGGVLYSTYALDSKRHKVEKEIVRISSQEDVKVGTEHAENNDRSNECVL